MEEKAGNQELPENRLPEEGARKIEKWRLAYIAMAIFLINFSFLIWYLAGYLNIVALVSVWALIIMSGILLLYALSIKEQVKHFTLMVDLAFILSIIALIAIYLQYFPTSNSDEILIDTYAGYLSLHGIDPYINANMLGVVPTLLANKVFTTPLLSGGVANYFEYPALAAIVFIPAILLGVPSYTVVLAFDVATYFLLYGTFRKYKIESRNAVVLIVFATIFEYAFFSVNGVTGIIWVFFLGMSFALRKKPMASGSFYGLALAFKQIPALILPFYLYFLYRESGGNKKYVSYFMLFAIVLFLGVNLPYIIVNAHDWIVNVLSIQFQSVVGTGIGPSILDFTGIIHVSTIFFSIALALLTVMFLAIYIIYYDNLKYAFFAFPVIIFLLEFRSLITYIIYWPVLIILVLPDFITSRRSSGLTSVKKHVFLSASRFFSYFSRNRKLAATAVVAIVFAGIAVSAGVYSYSPNTLPLRINGIEAVANPFEIKGNVTMIGLNISYNPANGDPQTVEMNYRIFASGELQVSSSGANGFPWYASDPYLHAGYNSVNIFPENVTSLLPATSKTITIQAYNALACTEYSVRNISTSRSFPLYNPDLSYPITDQNSVLQFPDWNFYSSQPGGLKMQSISDGFIFSKTTNSGVFGALNASINFDMLVKDSFTLHYNLSVQGAKLNDSLTNPGSSFFGPVIIFDSTYYYYFIDNSSLPSNTILGTSSQTTFVYNSNTSGINFSLFNQSLIKQMSADPAISINPNYAVFSYLLSAHIPSVFSVEVNGISLQSE